MPTYLTGAQATGAPLQAEHRYDVDPQLYWKNIDTRPFLSMLYNTGNTPGAAPRKSEVTSFRYDIFEKDPPAVWTAVNNGSNYTAGDTSIVVDSSAHIPVNSVIWFIGVDKALVTANNTGTNTLTVVRGYGTTAAGAVADNTPVRLIARTALENAVPPSPLLVQNVSLSNYTQILVEPISYSGTLKATASWIQNPAGKKEEMRQEARRNFERQINDACLWGEPKIVTTSGSEIRTTGGLNYWVTLAGNVTTISTTLTKQTLLSGLQTAMLYKDNPYKVMFGSGIYGRAFGYWTNNLNVMQPNQHVLNMLCYQILTTFGYVYYVYDPTFINSPAGTTTSGFGGDAFITDPSHLEIVYLQTRGEMFLENVIRDGRDGEVDCHFAEFGFKPNTSSLHYKITGVSDYS